MNGIGTGDGVFVGRANVPGFAYPRIVTLRQNAIFDITAKSKATVRDIAESPSPAEYVRNAQGTIVGEIDTILANSRAEKPNTDLPRLLSPVDLQAVKASGVTFVASLLERVIEEQALGDKSRAEALRQEVIALIGTDLSKIVPGSDEAMALKQTLIGKGIWSQYLEVGIGPDAEIFTKSQPMSSVGYGADVGLHPISQWNNPEPEIALLIASTGAIIGATIANDVNLRDVEGRSALLLGKAKDNNASCAIGPFIRLFDAHFGIDDVRRITVALEVTGPEGFKLEGSSSLSKISRDPLDLVSQAIGVHHDYPDGLMLFLGTMFAPTQDRHGPGQGFTHVVGDRVRIAAPELGALVNRVVHSDQAPRWTFGLSALMRNLGGRGLL